GAVRLMGKAIDLRQSETGTFAECFRREERLENPRQDVRRDADTGIHHRKGDEVSLKLIHPVALLQADVLRRQLDQASARPGIAGVARDVDERQFELRDVDLDRPNIGRYVALELDVST